MEPGKRVDTSSSKKKKRKSQPKMDAFLTRRPNSVQVGGASKDAHSVAIAQSDVPHANVFVDNVSASMSQGLDSSMSDANVNVNVASTVDSTSQGHESKGKSKRRWRSQWTLLHPWAYLCKSLLNEETIKCTYCEETKKVNIYTQEGSTSIMISALHDHALTRDHKDAVRILNARKRIKDAGKGPLDHGIETIVHTEHARILTCMKLVYFYACEDLPLEKYPTQCRLLRELGTPNIPASDEYGSYVNPVSGREMLLANKDHVKQQMLADMCASPFYSVLIDESMDRTMEKHLIIYVLYVGDGGKGRTRCCFVELLPVDNANAKGIYEAVSKFLSDNGLDIKKLIAIATDGASVMVEHKTGVVARFQAVMPRIMGVHCIAHRQALAAKDGFVSHPHVYTFVDKVANKVYSWLGRSAKRHTELWKIMSDYDIMDVKALQIHSVRWFSRGQVMERLVNIMPAVLEQWQRREKTWYGHATIFVVQFMIHLLADVLIDLNKLNVEFQRHEMDVTIISAMIDLTFEKLTRRYLSSDARNFGIGSKYFSSFLGMAKEGTLVYTDASGKSHTHVLKFKAIPQDKKKKKKTKTGEAKEASEAIEASESEGDDEDLDLNMLPEDSVKKTGSLEECISMRQTYVQNILNALTWRFEDLSVYNAFKVFSPSSYPLDTIDREKRTREWLERLINRLNVDSHTIDIRKCISKREDFVGMLYRVASNKSLHDAWEVCSATKYWWDLFPGMMNLWQLSLVIPASTAACERGFSRQNFIKNTSRSALGLDTLDALMFLSIDARNSSLID
ncbi:hypothetical protein L7F22_055209 [Adiantum nelumboides]|nr:hypothetical protein [Adiantum nelumboides]